MGKQRERSGTPLETREAARAAGDVSRDFFRFLQSGTGVDPRASLLGFDPTGIGAQQAAQAVLVDPADRLRGLFSALEPFERAETQRQVAGLREMFGAAGGRFSTGAGRAEAGLRSDLGSRFAVNREQALLSANAQRINALASLLGLSRSAADPFFGLGQPGPAVFEPSTGQQIAAGLIDLGGTLGSSFLLGG